MRVHARRGVTAAARWSGWPRRPPQLRNSGAPAETLAKLTWSIHHNALPAWGVPGSGSSHSAFARCASPASALSLADELEGIVTYDERLDVAAGLHGVAVLAPSGE